MAVCQLKQLPLLDLTRSWYLLQVGEFVEVSNGSKTDPCAWIGVVTGMSSKGFVVGP